MPKRKPSVSVHQQTKAKKLKIETKERKESKEEPIEEELIEEDQCGKKPKTTYVRVRVRRPIDGDPNSNLVWKRMPSLFEEMVKGNPNIKLEELKKITCGSGQIFNWGCLSHETCNHIWKARVDSRVSGHGCPYCNNGPRKIWCDCTRPSFLNKDGSYKLGKENMKRCTNCMEEKEKTQFSVHKSTKDGYHSWCSVCINKSTAFDKSVQSAIMRLYLQGKCCQDCQEKDTTLLEFDHINNDKFRNKKGELKCMLSLSPENLCRELTKTEIVCIRCHRLRTFSRHAGTETCSKRTLKKRQVAQRLKLERKCCLHCQTQITKETTHLFDCDHIDPEKKIAGVSTMIIENKYNLKQVKDEIKKCQLLCCKCHRKKTAKDRNWRKVSDFLPEVIAKARTFLDHHFKKDADGHYIHINPVKIEVVRINEKPKKPRKVPISKNVKALMASFANRKIDLNPSI